MFWLGPSIRPTAAWALFAVKPDQAPDIAFDYAGPKPAVLRIKNRRDPPTRYCSDRNQIVHLGAVDDGNPKAAYDLRQRVFQEVCREAIARAGTRARAEDHIFELIRVDALPSLGQKAVGLRAKLGQAVSQKRAEDDPCLLLNGATAQRRILSGLPHLHRYRRQNAHRFLDHRIEIAAPFDVFGEIRVRK